MTEQEWLTCDDPTRMLRWLQGGGPKDPPRKGLADDRQLRLWAVALYQAGSREWQGRFPEEWAEGEPVEGEGAGDPLEEARLWCNVEYDLEGDPPMAMRAAILRDIVRPFSPFPDVSRLASAEARRLAQCAYDGDWGVLPALWDALEESGVEGEGLRRHLLGQEVCWHCGRRGDGEQVYCRPCGGSGWMRLRGPHVRGCVAVDAVLGRR